MAAASSRPIILCMMCCARAEFEMTSGRFILMIVASIAVRGNAYVEKRLGGTLVSLIPLLRRPLAVRRNDAGALEYETADSKGGKRKLSADDVMHIRGFGLDGVCGLLRQLLSGVRSWGHPAANEAAARLFRAGNASRDVLAVESGFLKENQRAGRDSLAKFSKSSMPGS